MYHHHMRFEDFVSSKKSKAIGALKTKVFAVFGHIKFILVFPAAIVNTRVHSPNR